MRYTFLETMCPLDHYQPLAQAAEKAGFHGYGLADSIIYPEHSATQYPYLSSGDREFIGASPVIDPMVLATHMAAVTSTIEFTSFVLKLPVRNPILTAKSVSSVAALSGDRFNLGIGLSPWPEDFEACGQDWKNRGKRMEEMIDILRLAFTGEYFDYAGKYYQLPSMKMNPAPAKKVPILIGGHSEAAMRRAALMGDGWMHAGGDKDDPIPLIQQVLGYREEYGLADKPFSIYVISADAYTPEGIAKLEKAGVTDTIVGFRNVYDSSTASMGLHEKLDMLNGYAESVINA